MAFATIPEAIEEIRAGRMLVVVDDEDRENEGAESWPLGLSQCGSISSEAIDDVLAAHSLMARDGTKNRIERSNPESAMRWHRYPVR